MVGGRGNLLLSSLEQEGADSDGYSTVSEVPGGRCRRRWCRNEKCLTPVCLDMPIFESTDPNTDVTYTLWRFNVQGLLDQYDKASMIPHIFLSMQGYPGKWVRSLPEGRDISVSDLLAYMDHTFGNVHDCDTMIWCLYEICQKDGKTMEEYMLQIHEAVVVIRHAYPDRIADQGKNLTWDRFYHGLLPSLCDALSLTMADLPEREQENTSFDTLYMLAKKLEARQSSCFHKVCLDPLMPIETGISRGSLHLWGGLPLSKRRSYSHQTLKCGVQRPLMPSCLSSTRSRG